MQHFDDIYARAAARKGGEHELEQLLAPIQETTDLRTVS